MVRWTDASESLQDNLNEVANAGPHVIEWRKFTGYDNELVHRIETVAAGGRVRLPGRGEGRWTAASVRCGGAEIN